MVIFPDGVAPDTTYVSAEDIPCLWDTPRCDLREDLAVTISNVGETMIRLVRPCGSEIQHEVAGQWRAFFGPIACILIGVEPIEIPPGERFNSGEARFTGMSILRVPDGTYRVQFDLIDSEGILPEHLRTSRAFSVSRPAV